MTDTRPDPPTLEEIEQALREFARRLAAAQHDLPPETATVLYENLWELYE